MAPALVCFGLHAKHNHVGRLLFILTVYISGLGEKYQSSPDHHCLNMKFIFVHFGHFHFWLGLDLS